VKPLGVLLFIRSFGKGFLANLAVDRGRCAAGGRTVRGVIADDVAGIEVGRNEWLSGEHVLRLCGYF
jgi:hypothetical protein